jgi:hypothetical protein
MTEPSNPTQDQFGPCGILCGSRLLGNGAVAESAGRTRKHISDSQIPMWSPFVPGGEAIDWAAIDRALDWMTTYARCAGCRSGGGPARAEPSGSAPGRGDMSYAAPAAIWRGAPNSSGCGITGSRSRIT